MVVVVGCAAPDESQQQQQARAPGCSTSAECNDGMYCNGVESCVGGKCVTAPPVNCQDGVTCTYSFCDEQIDACRNLPDHAQCGNGQMCSAGGCTAAETCSSDAQCDDGLICNGLERCIAGACSGSPALACNDSVSCTLDFCSETQGCVNLPVDLGCGWGMRCETNGCAAMPDCSTSADCDDNVHCNGAEYCQSGSCYVGSRPSVSDGVSCTVDICEESGQAAVHVSDDSLCPLAAECRGLAGCQLGDSACVTDSDCDDGLYCDGPESCVAGACTAGARPNCVDGDFTTVDICDEATTRCVYAQAPADKIHCEGGACACPPRDPAATTLHADATADRSIYPGLVPNGREFPAACRYATLTAALGAAAAITPADVLLHGSTSPSVFAAEVFPLNIPGDVSVRPAPGSAVEHVIRFDGSATHAIDLAGTLAGVTVDGSGGGFGAVSGIVTTGSATVEDVIVQAFLGNGIQVYGDLVASRLTSRQNNGHGAVFYAGFINVDASTFEYNAGDGVVIGSTDATKQVGWVYARLLSPTAPTVVQRNGGRGIVVAQPSDQSSIWTAVAMTNNIVIENGRAGIVLHTAYLVDDPNTGSPFVRNLVSGNAMAAATCTAEQSEPQIWVRGPVAGDPTTCSSRTNEATCTDVGSTDCMWNPGTSTCHLAWDLSGQGIACSHSNRISGYTTSPLGTSLAVAIRAQDGAVVDARFNYWSGNPRTSSSPDSFMDSSTPCGALGCGLQ